MCCTLNLNQEGQLAAPGPQVADTVKNQSSDGEPGDTRTHFFG